jgi:hypothetical protein
MQFALTNKGRHKGRQPMAIPLELLTAPLKELREQLGTQLHVLNAIDQYTARYGRLLDDMALTEIAQQFQALFTSHQRCSQLFSIAESALRTIRDSHRGIFPPPKKTSTSE